MRIIKAISIAALLAAPVTVMAASPVKVTRFHLEQAISPGAFATAAQTGQDGSTIEFRTYANAVAREMEKAGYAEAAKPVYVAEISHERRTRERIAKRSPVSIGIGGGSFGRHVGVGVGTSFGLGGGGSREVVATEMAVRIKRVSDGQIVWEGRAMTEGPSRAAANQPGPAAERLARALFAGFPGESGKTITVR